MISFEPGKMKHYFFLYHFIIQNQCIGAVNTIIRRPSDGKLVGYNTDCEACITAIEDALRGNVTTYCLCHGLDMYHYFTF